jgi:hypothetical protein
MHRAVGAGGFFRRKGAFLQALQGVGLQLCALRAKVPRGAMTPAAVKRDHTAYGAFFAFDAFDNSSHAGNSIIPCSVVTSFEKTG